MVNLGDAVLRLRADVAEFKRDLTSAEGISKDRLETISKYALGASAAVAGISVAALKMADDYETATRGVALQTGATGSDLDRVVRDIQKAADQLPLTYSEIAETGAIVAASFRDLSGEPLQELIANLVFLQEEVGLNVELMGEIAGHLRTWGRDQEDVNSVLDSFVSTMQETGILLEEQIRYFKDAAPAIRDMGLEIEEANRLIGILNPSTEEYGDLIVELRSAWERAREEGKNYNEAVDALIVSLASAEDHTKLYDDAVELLGVTFTELLFQALADGKISLDAVKEAVDGGKDGLDALIDTLGISVETFGSASTAADSNRSAVTELRKENETLTDKIQIQITALQDWAAGFLAGNETMQVVLTSLTGISSTITALLTLQMTTGIFSAVAWGAAVTAAAPVAALLAGMVASVGVIAAFLSQSSPSRFSEPRPLSTPELRTDGGATTEPRIPAVFSGDADVSTVLNEQDRLRLFNYRNSQRNVTPSSEVSPDARGTTVVVNNNVSGSVVGEDLAEITANAIKSAEGRGIIGRRSSSGTVFNPSV